MKSYTNAQHAHLAAYVRGIADLVRLRDLDIEVRHDPPDDESIGLSEGAFGRHFLRVWFAAGLAIDRPELRQTVVHELLHAHFNPMRDLFLRVYDGEPAGDDVPAVFYRAFRERWELCLDTVATIIAESLPLIEPFPEAE